MTEISGAASTDSTPNRHTAVYDWESDGPVVVAVAEALATFSGRPADEIPPVYDAVDPDALDVLVRPRDDCGSETVRVAFAVPQLDCTVSVDADGRTEVTARR